MQLSRLAAGVALLAASWTPGAQAACTLVLVGNGTMTMTSDPQTVGTDQGGLAAPASFTVANTGITSVTVTVGAPAWVSYPAGFGAGSAQLEVAYVGAGLLNFVNQSYTSSQTSFTAPALLGVATLVTVNGHIKNSAGFRQGTYQTKTTVTCS